MDLRVEPGSSHDGSCDCCGDTTRTVNGFISTPEAAVAAYFVSWTLGAVASHGAAFDFIIGSWGEGTSADHRVAVSLEFQVVDAKPQFMVRDAGGRPAASSDLVSRALSRGEVIGTPLAAQVFNLVDAVWLHDARIAELSAA
jgi:hypothetical protein